MDECIRIPTYCPSCLNVDCVEHVDLGNEYDSDGEFGNHMLECTICGRRTCDMDTLEDAVEAWEERGDVVHFEGSDTVLLDIDDIIKMIESGKVPTKLELINKDLRDRIGG